jgi:hypothetical protein
LTRGVREIKAKGRPKTQCPTCRTKRVTGKGHAHHKCRCGQEPPKSFVTWIYIRFPNGFEMSLQQESDISVDELQSMVREKIPLIITVMKKKQPSEDDVTVQFTPSEVQTRQEEISLELDEILSIVLYNLGNPCRCHYGHPCICSERPNEDLEGVSKMKDAMHGLQSLNSESGEPSTADAEKFGIEPLEKILKNSPDDDKNGNSCCNSEKNASEDDFNCKCSESLAGCPSKTLENHSNASSCCSPDFTGKPNNFVVKPRCPCGCGPRQ